MTDGLICVVPGCGGHTKVKDSRARPAGIRRRRLCETCGHRFTTMETQIEEEDPSGARALDLYVCLKALPEGWRVMLSRLVYSMSAELEAARPSDKIENPFAGAEEKRP